MNCLWLSPIRSIDVNDIVEETKDAYSIFENDFISSSPELNNYPVYVRKYPVDEQNGRYSAFNHITTRDYNHINGNSTDYADRDPDIRRLERIEWVRLLIEHPNCKPKEECECKGTFMWYEKYHNTYRVNILFYDANFMVVLEKKTNKDFYLLVTAFYLENEVVRDNKFKKYKDDLKKPFVPETL